VFEVNIPSSNRCGSPIFLLSSAPTTCNTGVLSYGSIRIRRSTERISLTLALDTGPANHAIVSIGRYAVTLPTCLNWSRLSAADFSNAYSSNHGCTTATNLGLIVASPADLVGGRPFSGLDAQPAVNAVQRYLTDRVKQPPNPTPSPFDGGGAGGELSGGAPGGAPGAEGP
jgi:hypothetical protein